MTGTIRLYSSFLMLCIVALGHVAYSQETQQANAAELLERARGAAAQVVAAARSDTSLMADLSEAKPFWEGMKTVNESLTTARTSLERQDEAFFTGLANSVAGYAQAQIALIMNQSTDQSVSRGMDALGEILETLYQNYSKEAARLQQGGELTDAEAAALERLIAQQDELLAKLDEVERNVAANNQAMRNGIEELRATSRRIRNSRRTVAGFAGAFFSAHFMYDWLWGWHWWWGPWGGWCPGFIDINIIIWDDWSDAVLYDWDFVDAYVDVGDLGLDMLDIDAAVLAENLDYLDAGDFSLDDGDFEALTADLDLGWDDAASGTAAAIMDAYEQNFDNPGIYDLELPIETFEDFGIDDFGGGFDDFDSFDFGGFDDGFDFGGFDF